MVLVTGGLTGSRALSQELFAALPHVRRYETLPVAEPVKIGLQVPLLCRREAGAAGPAR